MVAEGVAKAYGGVQALKGVSLGVRAGEVHGLVGANGAGKSTLIKILAGLTAADAGRISVDGKAVSIDTPHDASALGMSFIHQELAFIPEMSVIENIMLGIPKPSRLGVIDWRAIERDVAPVAERVGLKVPLRAKARTLSTAEAWLVNICRALVKKCRLLVMDEPTASLSAREAERLLEIVEDLSRSGVAVLYVSHRLDEILRLCHTVTAFRDGESVAALSGDDLTREALMDAIVGGSAPTMPAEARVNHERATVALDVRGLARAPMVKGVDLRLHDGEVLGIGGLVGAGRSELARLIYGVDRPHEGVMTLRGEPYAPASPTQAVRAGLGFVPEERRSEGLILTKSVAFNMQLANLANIVRSPVPLIDYGKRRSQTEEIVRSLAVKTPDIETHVGRLSGGNQQKVVIGRWLLRRPEVLILDEPTRGVDVGARGEIHRLIRAIAADGMAVIVISSEPDELPDLCDRVLVMVEGRIVQELSGEEMTRNAIISASYASAT
ncbi:sugar ABC transporter ATP-binding protein [Acuticoccus sp. MNP-M23]|uniref:sugar ABC transporter ATP-binding protein n=1 Tax=Acuticoccus sp. MNP-M23 TaxID=3072793 RepID=UPI0028156962|nr:sugar ABC transporter ATP-binding protein [Acuticoccus sp. MNP-M23]WMS43909.1 sugar ABC transporter ATP-binding protein [Acuticoccus sp. MNP-M23]